jgi:hypothetical protein
MGVFDTITCKYPLTHRSGLNDRLSKIEWQTKDLGNRLDRYEVRADGSLWGEIYDGPVSVDAKNHRWAKSSFSGVIRIAGELSRREHEQYEFELTIERGIVVSVVPIG